MKIKTITAKNFLSTGNQEQKLDLNTNNLTLVLGENLDAGDNGNGNRNGVGKSAMINALSYALFGKALSKIKKDNLINHTNAKNMLVTVELEHRGKHYKIERGRRPNVLKFFIGDAEFKPEDDADSESQGDSRATQIEIEKTFGLSHLMFVNIIALNTYNVPFLSMGSNDQREIIESLLGITLLSEKAKILSEHIKDTKYLIQQENFRIKSIQDTNKKIQDQIKSLKKRQSVWKNKLDKEVEDLAESISNLEHVDIAQEIAAHQHNQTVQDQKAKFKDLDKWKKSHQNAVRSSEKIIAQLEKEIQSLEDHECYACGQKLHDQKHQSMLDDKKALLQEHKTQLVEHQNALDTTVKEIEQLGEIPKMQETFYNSLEDAQEHKNTLDYLEQQLLSKSQEQDPYVEQIQEMKDNAIEEVSWDEVNTLSKTKDHQEFLFKLLTNKDSFIRKKIIDQNLAFLNKRLGYYLKQIGLPHSVVFKNDLSVEIQDLGRDLDFDNLSRGERTRLILSLSWAFRDVWENLYAPINLLFVDELLDNGLDQSGIEASLHILKSIQRDRAKSIWLISHRDELIGRVDSILKVVKEGGFTSYEFE